MKKILCFALALVLVVSMAAIPGIAAPASGVGYQEVDGTVPDGVVDITTFTQDIADDDDGKAYGYSFTAYSNATKIGISSADGLMLFATIVNSGSSALNTRFQGKTVYLTEDINMSGYNWTPIGNDIANDLNGTNGHPCFRGTFDGLGHTIDNLKVTSSADGNVNVALFGVVGSANIKNLVIGANCSFTYTGSSANARTAALVGRIVCVGGDNAGAGTDATGLTVATKIENVKNLATVSSTTFAGGIVGSTRFATNASILFQNVTNAGNVTADTYAAGIVGMGGTNGRYFDFEKCVNEGNITANGNAAGIICSTYALVDKDIFIKSSYVSGKIQGANVDPLVIAAAYNSGYINLDANGNDVSQAVLAIGSQIGYDPAKVEKVDLSSASPITAIESNFNANSVYYISTPEELVFFANYVNGLTAETTAKTCMWGKKVYLANDIDMFGVTMAPIGSVATSTDYANITAVRSFAGTFDGQGYVIDNLVIESDATNVGLFGILSGATVKNVVLGSGCVIKATGAAINVGAIAGMARRCWFNQASRMAVNNGNASNDINQPHASIENCFSAATVTAPTYAGGIVGATTGNTNDVLCARVFACTNVGAVTSETFAAGVVAYSERNVLIVSCRNAGTITTTAEETGATAGAAGISANMNVANDKFAIVSSCVNNGEIIGNGTIAGIVAVKQYKDSGISANKDYGTLTAPEGAINVDAICGYNVSGSTYEITANETLENDAAWTDVKFVGTQIKSAGNGKYAVRFLATVNDLDAFNSVGFKITAAYADKVSDPAKGVFTTSTVFTGVVAVVDDVSVNVSPAAFGGCYFVAITVSGISDSYGDVTFTVNTLQDGAVSAQSYEVVYNAGELVD